MTLDWTADQKQMMRAFGQETETRDTNQGTLYLKMMVEELIETMIAANSAEAVMIKAIGDHLMGHAFVAPDADVVEMFDGAVDLHVVTQGFGVSMGFPMREGWDAVLSTNIVKVDPVTGLIRRRKDGKVLKPDGWVAPTVLLQGLLDNPPTE